MKINWKSTFQLIGIGLLLILGVMIILPNFLNVQGGPARQAEGPTVTGTMNRAQQYLFKENNQFTTNFEELGIGLKSETEDYVYKIVFQSNPQSVMNIGQAKRKGFKSYVGLVYVVKVGEEYTTITKMCKSIKSSPLSKLPQIPELPKNAATSEDINCPSGFEPLYPRSKKR